MHALLAAVLSYAVFSSASPLSKRYQLPPYENCGYLAQFENADYCGLQSSLSRSTTGYIGAVYTDGKFDSCQVECLRNPDCQSTLWQDDGYCFLFVDSLKSLGVYADPKSNHIHTDRACGRLFGVCLPHQGNFESLGIAKGDDPFYNGTVHPWSQNEYADTDDDSNFQLVQSGSQAAKPVSNAPVGTHFIKGTLHNAEVSATIYQGVNLPDHSHLRLILYYNFASYVQLFGKAKPKSYQLYAMLGAADLIIDEELPVNATNRWIKKQVDFVVPTTAEGAYERLVVGIYPNTNGPLTTSSFQAIFGIDGISITRGS